MHAQKAPAGLRARLCVRVRTREGLQTRHTPTRFPRKLRAFGSGGSPPGRLFAPAGSGSPGLPRLPSRFFSGFSRVFLARGPGFRAFRPDPGPVSGLPGRSGVGPGSGAAPGSRRSRPGTPGFPRLPPRGPRVFPARPGKTAGAFAPPRPRAVPPGRPRPPCVPGPPGFSHFATRKSAL